MKLNHYVSAVILSAMITSTFAVTTTDDVVPNAAVSSLSVSKNLIPLTDNELGEETGQALLNVSYLAPGDANNPASNTALDVGFYTVGLEGDLALNANIKNLQLGCGGVNGDGKCDIDAQNVSFGCVANAAGNCISLGKDTTKIPPEVDGAIPDGSAGTGALSSVQSQLKDFVLSNPFLQFAIQNPNSASTRQVVGLRLGASKALGPLSFGTLNTLSGYLSGTGDITLRGQGPNIEGVTGNGTLAPTADENAKDLWDVAATCEAPAVCPDAAGRSVFTNNPTPNPPTSAGGSDQTGEDMRPFQYLSLDDENICLTLVCVRLRVLTVNFATVKRPGLPVTASGNRITQAFIANANLGRGTGGAVKSITDSMNVIRTTSGLGASAINDLLPLIRSNVAGKVNAQLAKGLDTTIAKLDDDTYQIPYNLKNVHQLNIDTSQAGGGFGISLQSQALQYPGYAASVPTGWALYAAKAFNLTLNRRTTEFVQGILLPPSGGQAGVSDAANGNIVGLAPSYRNCYGSLKFC